MSGRRCAFVAVVLGVVTALAGGCDSGASHPTVTPDAEDQGAVSLIRPPAVLEVRAIDREQLFPEVVVDDTTLSSESAGDGVWRVLFRTTPNSRVDVSITWFERYQGLSLPLARTDFPVTIADSDQVFQVPATQYDGSGFDQDGDGVSNIDERRNGTDPLAAGSAPTEFLDDDGDGFPNDSDNCSSVANPNQENLDGDAVGDACDSDADGDGIANDEDNCPANADPAQSDSDGDGVGDVCDESADLVDADADDVADAVDNCPATPNPDQQDSDGNGVGDVCEPAIGAVTLSGEVELAFFKVSADDEAALIEAVESDDQDAFEALIELVGSFGPEPFEDVVGEEWETAPTTAFLIGPDPDNPVRTVYLEFAILDAARDDDGAIDVDLRSLMFIEAPDLVDEGDDAVYDEVSSTLSLTLEPGTTVVLDDSFAVSDAVSDFLFPIVETPDSAWLGRITGTLQHGGTD